MICTETRGNRVYTYSDAGMMILQDQTGILYRDAIDVPEMGYTYTETDQPVPDDEISAEEALDILMGGEGRADDTQDGAEV